MNAVRAVFPRGVCDHKTRYLVRGFQEAGIEVEVKGESEKIGVTEFRLIFADGREAVCGHDIGCLKKRELSRGKGEARPWWEGREGEIFFFKTHAAPSILDPERRIFSIPQAIGKDVFLSMLPAMRKAIDGRRQSSLDIFGIFTDGGARAEACWRVKNGPWRSLVGIMKRRKNHTSPLPRGTMTAALEPAMYFEAMAAARLALSFPSVGTIDGPWCSFRHVEAWALGVPVVTFRPSDYHVFARPAEPFWFEVAPDLSDLGLVLNYALSDEARLADFRGRSRRHFDDHFTPARVAEYVMKTVEERL